MKAASVDPRIRAGASPTQAKYIDAVIAHGSIRAAARALDVNYGSVRGSIVAAEANAARSGGAPRANAARSGGADTPIPDAVQSVPQEGRRTLVITCAVNATPAHVPFVQALEGYCAHNGASLLCIPLRYKNPTSQAEASKSVDWWAPEVAKYLISHRESLAPELVLLADIRTQPTASAPLTGFEGLTGGASGIIGHPQIALTTVPTPQHKLPKILATTGSCTHAVYSESKAGARGEFNHSLGALVVEIEADGAFHLRQIVGCDDGSFEDLDTAYSWDGSNAPNGGVAALVMGDSHIDFIDAGVVTATFTGSDAMMQALRPERLVWHDILDCYSVSHHHERDPITQFAKHHTGRNDVRAEIQRVFDFVDTHSPAWCTNVFVASNHIDHLGQWVRSTDPRRDPANAIIWAELYHALCTHAEMGAGGAKTIDPFVYLAQQQLESAGRSVFLGRDQSYAVKGIELSMHGDRGPNGARGARKAFDKVGVKSIVGHSHSPGITGGVYQVGTSSRYDLEYASGPSSWLHTHCVVYRNGKRSLINIIGDRWRSPARTTSR